MSPICTVGLGCVDFVPLLLSISSVNLVQMKLILSVMLYRYTEIVSPVMIHRLKIIVIVWKLCFLGLLTSPYEL
jgi:hypothetical protein